MPSPGQNTRMRASVRKLVELTPRVVGLSIQAPSGFRWVPGQHVALGGDEQGAGASYYSIASAPLHEAPGVFEIAAVQDALPDELRVHDERSFWLSSAQGEMPFGRLQSASHVVLIGMGTGVSPLRAVATALLQSAGPSVTLYQGARMVDECLYYQELQQLAGDRFTYQPVLSRANDSWSGLRGHVQEHLETQERSPKTEYCVCGSSQMVSEVKAVLMSSGASEERIFTEGY